MPTDTRRLRSLLGLFAAALLALVAALGINVVRKSSRQLDVAAAPVSPTSSEAAGRLAQLIQRQTISYSENSQHDASAFVDFKALLTTLYPRTHATLAREEFGHSLLYRWPGSDTRLPAVLLMAHYDVVPADEADRWTYPPFAGQVAQGYVWGRGALDMKGPLAAIMESVESLAGEGFRPQRTVYLAFGHDEEIGGRAGNALIAQWLKDQRVRLHAVLDEGSVVTQGILPNIARPVALIGIAEKGYLSIELSVESQAGHSSMPAPETSVEILARALLKVTALRDRGSLSPAVREQLEWLAPELPWPRRLVLSNLWLFEPLVKRQMGARPAGDAMLRTTIAPTMLRASAKENVLPQRVSALVNFRLLQGTRVAQVLERVHKAVGDARVKVAQAGSVASEPSPVASTASDAFATLHRSVRAAFPDAMVAPSLVLGATDSRYYLDIAEQVYRFIPVRLVNEDLARIHGQDERLALTHLAQSIAFYTHYLRQQ